MTTEQTIARLVDSEGIESVVGALFHICEEKASEALDWPTKSSWQALAHRMEDALGAAEQVP